LHQTLITNTCAAVMRVEAEWLQRASARQLELTKPPHSLGRLETVGNQLAAQQRTVTPRAERKRLFVVAADHGVTAEGVSAYPSEVTAQMVANFLRGGAAINVLARLGQCEVKVVDAGVAADLSAHHDLIHEKIVWGTANFAQAAALTTDQALRAVAIGIGLAREASAQGIQVVGIGEMGIGNTTSASALTAALTGQPVEHVTGTGTGIDDEQRTRKCAVVRRALALHQLDDVTQRYDALELLACVGGAEIGVMTGIVLGAAAERLAVVADGFISTAAAALAHRWCPAVSDYLFVAHRSVEPGQRALLELLQAEPLLDLQMRLGEGTGAALAMHLLDAAARLMCEMATFASAGVSDKSEAR
jgi:nicotinate-nucleotide--dimethylbenzimidazole phosphoribosyltransferase